MPESLADDYAALAVAAAAPLERDAIGVSGPEAGSYLQGQLSQDVEHLPVGTSTWSWVLQPTGKVDALVRVTRTEDSDWVLDVDGGFGAAVLQRLTRFKLRTKADLVALDWQALALRGTSLGAVPAPVGGIAANAGWAVLPGVDLLGPAVAAPDGAALIGADALEVARIEVGMPKMGTELTGSTIPAETGLVERTVSFTKGCYTGQELVARIDSRGSNVARHLRGLILYGLAAPGAELVADGKVVGQLTSVAESPSLGWVALGYVGRAVAVGDEVAVDGGGTALVRELPLRG